MSGLPRQDRANPKIDRLSSKCGFATLFDPHGGRPASAGLGALRARPSVATRSQAHRLGCVPPRRTSLALSDPTRLSGLVAHPPRHHASRDFLPSVRQRSRQQLRGFEAALVYFTVCGHALGSAKRPRPTRIQQLRRQRFARLARPGFRQKVLMTQTLRASDPICRHAFRSSGYRQSPSPGPRPCTCRRSSAGPTALRSRPPSRHRSCRRSRPAR